ncbi:PAS domain-containing protein [Francisella sp. TX07-6608]|uniref:PAS domain-containing protein n=1 Tax=Francisella sp. TX07-6608 TaxID=573568 RepID=UPI0008F9CAF2|nr:PAS domain-containing protein [Francisella sp. TX07-6608]OIN82969.1 sensory box protein [Francisella sp. TX07-6608]
MSDMTEKRIKELEQQNKVYKDIIDSLNIDIYWKDSNGKLLGANKNFINTLKTDEKNIIGKLEGELVGVENREEIASYERIAQLANTDVFLREQYKDKNSKIGTFLTQRKILKDENGNVEKIIVISIDSNQFKDVNMDNFFMIDNLDVTFQQIINTIDANIYWKNTQGQYIGMNQSNAESLKVTNIKDALYKTELELLGNDNVFAKNILMNDLKVIHTGSNISYEETYPTKNNELGTYLAKKACLKDKKGNVIGLVGVSVDITKQNQLQKDLAEKNRILEEKEDKRISLAEQMLAIIRQL